MLDKIIKEFEMVEPLVDIVNQTEVTAMAKFLYERIKHPDSYVVFLGETSSGKSSIINGMLGENVLSVKAGPSTAAITEVELNDDVDSGKSDYYAINKNATIESLSKATFTKLTEHPDALLSRLKIVRHTQQIGLGNVRIFDTPGYGSIVAEHEEVLKDFLPNSDVIVYTVNYKIGIQEDDYIFLRFIQELVRPDVDFILLINRCPVGCGLNNLKIAKIRECVSDALTRKPVTFIMENIASDEGHALVHCPDLWKHVATSLNSGERMKKIENAFHLYILDLYAKCNAIIESRYLSSKINKDEVELLKKEQRETAERIKKAIPQLIIPTFQQIAQTLPQKFVRVVDTVQRKVSTEITKSDATDMEQMIGYTNVHLLPFYIRTETRDEVQNYLDIVLDDLNNKVEDYIQKEYIHFNNSVAVIMNTYTDVATSQLMANAICKFGRSALEGYFVSFGGMGGANAGIANAASHLLKKAGDCFGHTFTRGTHNGLKHALAKVGATSMKTIAAAVAVVTEAGFEIYQLSTWKKKLNKKVGEGLDKWYNETLPVVIKDMKTLCEQNVEIVQEIADNILNSFEDTEVKDFDRYEKDYLYSKSVGEQLNNI